MGGYAKKVLWWLLVGCVAVAAFRGIGGIANVYPWLVKESHQFQSFILHLVHKVPLDHLKPLKSIIPKILPSRSPSH